MSIFKYYKISAIILVLIIFGCSSIRNYSGEPDYKSKSLPEVIEQIKKGIAYIEIPTQIKNRPKVGTGFLLDEYGTMVTCNHVVFCKTVINDTVFYSDSTRIFIKFDVCDTIFSGRVVVHDSLLDIAIISIDLNPDLCKKLGLLPVELGINDEIVPGLPVACSGYEGTQNKIILNRINNLLITHQGIISSVCFSEDTAANRIECPMFQIDVLVFRGISGGPVYSTTNGRVLGYVSGSVPGDTINGKEIRFGLSYCTSSSVVNHFYEYYLNEKKEK